MKSQINLIVFSMFAVLTILVVIYVFFTSLSISSKENAVNTANIYATIVYRDVMSPMCLGDIYHPLGHINITKLNYFLTKYTDSFLPCIKDPTYGYSVKIVCGDSSYSLGVNFPNKEECIKKAFPGELNDKECMIFVTVCTGSYSKFLSFLYNVCNKEEYTHEVTHKTFLFDRMITIENPENNLICENGICNKLYCKNIISWVSKKYYGLFTVFTIGKSPNKVLIV